MKRCQLKMVGNIALKLNASIWFNLSIKSLKKETIQTWAYE